MKFTTILKKAGIKIISSGGRGDPDITDISCDSRTVKKGGLFVAIPGTKEQGDAYIGEAVRRGAAAVVSGNKPVRIPVPWAKAENPRRALGLLGKAYWQAGTRPLQLVGITGTNGKTTTAHLFSKLFEQRFGAERVWMFGTIDYRLGKECRAASYTTPEALDIFRLLGTTVENSRPRAVVMEVSSHSLALDRVAGLVFDAAVFTNLTQDHLDFHKTLESYYQAKKRLFTGFLRENGSAAVNIDDPYGRRLAEEIGGVHRMTFGRTEDADVRIISDECSWEGTAVELDARGKRFRLRSPLRGRFNAYNLTGLCAGALALGFETGEIERACAAVATVPGRMERIAIDAPFSVIVDYAHTPDALVNILQTSRLLTTGRLICVFGCGGDRDRTKRPLMGEAVASFSDEAVVTSDNPRSEAPGAIIGEITAGMPLDFPHMVVANRREAIQKALAAARQGDCVVIAGKGHEAYQEIKGVRYPFSDKEIVFETYEEIAAHAPVG